MSQSSKSTSSVEEYLESFKKSVREKNPNEKEFMQAVEEFADTIAPFVYDNKKYKEHRVLERMTEPDRIISFRVCWEDDQQNIQINKGYRVQFNNTLGPYKGGLRFHPTVNQSILKFLGFEQVFKNSLTGLQLGGGKGGADFDPSGRSDHEIMRFCQSFMTELSRYIGAETDVPAGDIGVGQREISYLFGQYKRIENVFKGVLTGKEISLGGSSLRIEATGYGLIYFAENVLNHHDEDLKEKRCLVSGAGNVAQHSVEKLIEKGATVLTMSDSKGTIYVKEGITSDLLEKIADTKSKGGSLSEVQDKNIEYKKGKKPWMFECDYAFPCATQNEVEKEDIENLSSNGCKGLFEGANMPCTADALSAIEEQGVLYAPGKASNSGGVIVSGFEMSQNSSKVSWSRDKVDGLLADKMKEIHDQCIEYGKDGDKVSYKKGANMASFIKVADSMIDHGIT